MPDEPLYRKTPSVLDLRRKRAADEAALEAERAAREATLRVVERWKRGPSTDSGIVVVAPDNSVRHHRRNAVAVRLLSRVPDQPRDRRAQPGPAPARFGGKPCARARVYVVQRRRADARADRVARAAAGREVEQGYAD